MPAKLTTRHDDDGSIVALVAIMLVPLVIGLAIVVDSGRVWAERAALQNAVEVTAAAAASSWIRNNTVCPSTVLDYLLDPANVAMLRQVLLHHVVSGSLRANDLETKSYTALDGTALKVVIRKSGITIDGSRVTMGDVIATNGVIHGVSRVIVPSSLVLP